ncbi:hypothetical protein H6G76_19370 [Nostoc sp. FACHB-152]|uniref:hypothetical protein n=1 Tax=unclassified Nostoc TaxID=2593658 RepID=UPI001684E05B|nr:MULTISPECIES: hypothetical protein [unclassified Nostoc]MBD2449278.1 hypothetical protein [Nostoc sp. FACHB-152]MBD2470444.1 hypothetical protein [Nostoc sp. FACHB-145]
MKQRQHILQKADSSATVSEEAQFQSQPLKHKTQQQTNTPLSQTEVENQEFQQQQLEATKLAIQAKHGTITPEGQTQLTLLQAKMNDVLQRRVEQGSGFGHNLEKIALHHPDRMPSPIVQAKLAIAQPGDKNEQQADQVAATVVNQINQKTIQKQETSQTTTEQNQKSNAEGANSNASDPKQTFLSNYAVAKELVHGIDDTLPQEKILDQLLNNFKNISFKYTMTYKQGVTLLKGTREGDCKTLAEAFQTVAQEYFGIQNVAIEQIKKPFLSEAPETLYQGRKRNCDNGKRWFFQNHYWATWNNKVYDVLFLSNKRTEADMARQEKPLKSMLMPEGEYYETEKGKVVYPRGNEYLTMELGMFEKLKNFINNLGRWLAKEMNSITNQIKKLLSRGGNNNSDLESLMRDVQNNTRNEINSNNAS